MAEITDATLANVKEYANRCAPRGLVVLMAADVLSLLARIERAKKERDDACVRLVTESTSMSHRIATLEKERDEARQALTAYEHHVNTGRSEQHDRLLARIATLEAALRHLSAYGDTLSPQEIINNAASALGVDRHEYAGSGSPHASNVGLTRLVAVDESSRREMLIAVSNLSRTVAPLLAVFREGEGGTVESDQVDAAVSAMAEVQRCETEFGGMWFDRLAALRGLEGEVSDLRNAVARDRDDWMQSDEGLMCQIGTAADQYLRNRLERAFLAGHEKGCARGVRAGLEAAAKAAEDQNDVMLTDCRCGHLIAVDIRALSAESIAKEAADAAE